MNLQNFLAELQRRDIQIWADGYHLRCKAPTGVLTTALREQLMERKSEILAFLRSAASVAQQPRAIVPLQPLGSRAPVFAVAGHNGDIFAYRSLANHLGKDQPFFGLEPPGLDGENEPLETVEDLAAYFATQIQAFQPNGPYIIAGYCAGGAIAFELAQQLQQRGAIVRFLALFAAPYPSYFRFPARLSERIALQIERVREHAGALMRLSSSERSRYISELRRRYKSKREAAIAALEDPVLVRRAKLSRITGLAVSRYAPRSYDGRIRLFLPNEKWVRSLARPLRWRAVAPNAEQYFGPEDCNPDVLLLDPDAPVIAEFFKQCRDRIAAEDHSVNAVQAAIRIPAQRPLSEPSERRVAKESLAS